MSTDTDPQASTPDARGYFGRFGGVFVPEVLIEALARLEQATQEAFADPAFWAEYEKLLRDYVGRPSPPPVPRGRAARARGYRERRRVRSWGGVA
ncbi:MAG TPA: hypothetical protein VIW69_20125 [Candidatus Elarobacter sp.]